MILSYTFDRSLPTLREATGNLSLLAFQEYTFYAISSHKL
jgi:hypothetical protein